MNWIADLFLVVVILTAAWYGKKKGLIQTFFSFFGSIISFILAAVLARPIGSFLGKTFFSQPLKEYLIRLLSDQTQLSVENLDFSVLPEICWEILGRFNVTEDTISEAILSLGNDSAQATVGNIAEWIVDPIAQGIGIAITFLILFVAIYFAVKFLVKTLDLISKLPILNFSNHFLGLIFGVLWGVFLSFLISGLLSLIAPSLQGSENAFLREFDPEKTILVRFLIHFDLFGVFAFVKG